MTGLRLDRPQLMMTVTSAIAAVILAILMMVDDRTLLGEPLWLKPFKFFVSAALLSGTLAYIVPRIDKAPRATRIANYVIVVSLAVELILITGAAAFEVRSHFNVSTPLAAAVWSAMAGFITALWVATMILTALFIRSSSADPLMKRAFTWGLGVSLVGMGVAFLMTPGTAEQVADFQGVVGAHTVGAADGGPGLPFVGWSTEAGDLRVAHFVGLHALQVVPLVTFLLRRRITARGVNLIGVGYLVAVGLLTAQALAGQSVADTGPVLAAAIAGALLGAIVAAVAMGKGRPKSGVGVD